MGKNLSFDISSTTMQESLIKILFFIFYQVILSHPLLKKAQYVWEITKEKLKLLKKTNWIQMSGTGLPTGQLDTLCFL